ncbi:hypothetical protein J7E50_21420 [Pedobacter sp. ISL-68]|uniref:hypothetical protein n=1 Tax=unclassified Pedobacter TaxID=2628915 RepID=UPI001BE67419|nr:MULTISPECIES: hypothetical protein [unclassified Pedobacter]MBT2563801.1 hypothetical protein [Pedobacter sp. ISL-64]MBT2592793.1 hypothetical protein [Pedobacter sp. ISL-68]
MYYSIENSTGKDVGNVFPQASCLNQDLAHSIQFDEFSNFDSEILFKLEPKAKLTDVLSQAAISAYGFLVNNKVRQILEGFNLMEHRYYKCLVKDQKGVVHDYYWLHLVDDNTKKIDYSNSIFYWTKSTFRKGILELNSYEDYLKQKKDNGLLWGVSSEKLKLNTRFDTTLDLVSNLPFDSNTYISAGIRETINKLDITGIEINEAPNIS